MRFYILSVIFLLAGCATTAKYERMLESWIGAPERELLYVWGVPVRSYTVDENLKFLTFRDDRTLYVPGYSNSYTNFYGNSMTTTTYGDNGTTLGLTCETTFGIRYGMVISYRYEGNNCVTNEDPPQM